MELIKNYISTGLRAAFVFLLLFNLVMSAPSYSYSFYTNVLEGYMHSLEMAGDGYFYAAGQDSAETKSSIFKFSGNKHAWIQKTLYYSYRPQAVGVDNDNGCLLGSGARMYREDGSTYNTICIDKFDTDGNIEWEWHFGTSSNTFYPTRIKTISDANYISIGLRADYPYIAKISRIPSTIWELDIIASSLTGFSDFEELADGSLIAVTGRRF